MKRKCIAVDVLSGDFGSSVILPATFDYLKSHSKFDVLLVGDETQIIPKIPKTLNHRISIIHCIEVVGMDEKPTDALRKRKTSSLFKTVQAVSDAHADACVSAGNTGALMAISKVLLGMMEGISRPAILGQIPSLTGKSFMLDMGGNVDCDANQLHEFASLGSLLVQLLDNQPYPRVALLNNGAEEIKGNTQVKTAADLLRADSSLNYIGFLEGNDLFQSIADVIVCDGFVGNVALKSSEGVANFITQRVSREIKSSYLLAPLLAVFYFLFRRVAKTIDPRQFNGALFLGLQSLVVKSHGHADRLAFYHALLYAGSLVEFDIIARMQAKLEHT